MANTDAAFGLRPVQHLDGSPWNGKVNMYLVPAANGDTMFLGDPVISGGDAGGAGLVVNGLDMEGVPTIVRPVAGSTLLGVIVGFLPNQDNLMQTHRAASQARVALVCDSPDVIYEVQEDSDAGAIAATSVNFNADMITYAAGSTTTGRSIVEIDSSTADSTTAQFRLLGLAKQPGNILGSFAKWLVVINEHERKTLGGS